MSTTSSAPTLEERAVSRPRRALPRWSREPLVHFVLLGALLFGIDHVVAGRADDPHAIVVTAEVDGQARDLFRARMGRDPGREELEALRRVWLDNEVLYREGLALQVDRGDDAIRERVIFKALSVVDAGLKLPAYDDNTLRTWFDSHRAKYDEPARYDFQEAVLYGETSESAVREFAQALNKGMPGDAKAGLRVFKGRPHANVVDSYGPEFAKALEESTPGQWVAYRVGNGWRAMRLDIVTPGKPAVFESLRGVVLQDWTDARMSEQRTAAVRALARKYSIKYEAPAR